MSTEPLTTSGLAAATTVSNAGSTAQPGRARLRGAAWPIVITGAAQFMAALDNLVVTMALPVIREKLHTGLAGLQWTVNAYTLTFAVLLLTGATLGDRFGRRRMFVAGIALFTLASAAAALAPTAGALIAARAVQGAGGAMLVPLSLTLLSASVPAQRRNAALGIWGAIGGLAVAVGPLVGGAVVQGISWQWIFWLNVPIGAVVAPLAWFALGESHGPRARLDLAGVALASAGLFGIVFGLVRGGQVGWGASQVLVAFAGGAALLAGFIAWERRSPAPMLPLGLFAGRRFSLVNVASLLMSFGMFGSIFLLAQFLQTVQHISPLDAGIRTLPWTAMPVLVAPLAGRFVDRIGGRTLITVGLSLQAAGLAWMAAVSAVHVSYAALVPAFVISGIGMSLFFVPVASVVLSSVRPADEGVASGINNAMRELGGVLGIAVLGAVFSGSGGYATGATFVSGLVPAVAVGAGVVVVAVLAALAMGTARSRRARGRAEEAGIERPGTGGPSEAEV
ncbi:MAG TPA: DHA2 family efflux MFS transporter permease subunit, partial [Acidimicrobiales bacterium]|nr:DHA2 family efflux MFS transporter permease subunit [Acidimicrobiales bacterium]